MVRNVNSMKTKLTQTPFFILWSLCSITLGFSIYTTKDLKSGFHNLETSAYSKSREGKAMICVSALKCGSQKFKYPADKSTENLFIKQQDL